MRCMNRHLLLLSFCQSLFLTNNVTFIAINGLVGLALAPVGWMATLPVTGLRAGVRRCGDAGVVDAGALGPQAFVPDRLWWRMVAARWRLRRGVAQLLVAAAGHGGGRLLCANAALYRFAGPELVAPAYKEKAISYVLAGGIVARSSGRTWPVPRATCCPCRLPGPTWR
jgi:hypothetical protein